ncbi:division/cell wall cluster transcriptional repressor MraZ [Thalassotalea mangrovi]|uniref:Transcriptional regulator MraZ n=1 Tax=Thalassotalea mangrovi TaxID=2572245 RepID=A0A4U1BB64_9GAMM|nr:division/cell wall cluster transcriptional repressor MraZ [Thalassotalea mangrovi]TKB47667.1 division/cell wall cluster transcriptional repressor MraZ [Thalassotalea mangrovi]
MFRGANKVTLDSKSRLTIPTRYREVLCGDFSGKLVCTVDIQNPCLLLYPLAEWEEIELKLSRLSSMIPQERMFQQVLLGNATECDMDKNGRLLISPVLREHANLNKACMLVGQFNKFEIWDEQRWQQQMQQGIASIQSGDFELTERLEDFSL